MNNGGAVTVNVTAKAFDVPAVFVAVTVNVNTPAVTGVPDSTPVLGFNDTPPGAVPVNCHDTAGDPPIGTIWELIAAVVTPDTGNVDGSTGASVVTVNEYVPVVVMPG